MRPLITEISQDDIDFSKKIKQADLGKFTIFIDGVLLRFDTMEQAETFIALPIMKQDIMS